MLRLGRDRRVGGGVQRAEVDRAGLEQVLRQRLAAGAAPRGLVRLVVLLVVVVLVVVVVAAEQAVGELAQPLGDLVHRGGGDDQQAEEAEQGQQDDGDDRADAGAQRRADGPAEQAAGAGDAAAAGRRPWPSDLGDAERPTAIMRQPADDQPAARLGARRRGAAAAARRRRGRRAAP